LRPFVRYLDLAGVLLIAEAVLGVDAGELDEASLAAWITKRISRRA
jgi:hypothetical protein